MDPITLAIVSALTAGIGSGVTKVAEQGTVDGYNSLKSALKKKFGDDSDVVKTVAALESKPGSEGRKATLQEEIADSKADKDPDILKVANDLLEQIKAQPNGEKHIQTAIGSYIAQADRGSTATIKVNQPKE